jgi:hypothetical protein
MGNLVDVSTVLAAVTGLWAISFAWWTYVAAVRQQNENELVALKSIIEGLRNELDLMKPWTGADGDGYSQNLRREEYPSDWSNPSRIIWKFGYDTIRSLSQSPYAYHFRTIISPFVRLTYSVSRLFQFYDEYRAFVASRPQLYDQVEASYLNGQPGTLSEEQRQFLSEVRDFNRRIHLGAIGGKDARDEACLYKAYKTACEALDRFDATLESRALPKWFFLVHFVSALTFLSGVYLICRLLMSLAITYLTH